jgi:hypothetical protein
MARLVYRLLCNYKLKSLQPDIQVKGFPSYLGGCAGAEGGGGGGLAMSCFSAQLLHIVPRIAASNSMLIIFLFIALGCLR